MSNRQIEAILKISAKMGNTSALRALEKQMSIINRQATAFNRANALAARHSQAAWARTSKALGPILAAYGGVAAVRNYAEIERQVGRIGATADASADQTDAAMARLRATANDLRIPFDQVVEGMDSLVASGKSLDEAFALLPSVGKAAHASGADFKDMATTADAISGSLGIMADRMESAFDILAYGGKIGKFELKDMAAELPSIAPAFAALGYKGEEGLKKLVSMLQVVRMETGTSGEAATSFMDVISKMETTNVANNFKRFGVDVRKELTKAKRNGEDVLDAFQRLAVKAVKGDLSKLPQLFTDKQMLIGMRALINHAEQGKVWEGEMANAIGTVNKDWQRFANDTKASIDVLSNSFDRLSASAGKSLASMGASSGMDAISENLDKATAINLALEKKGYGWWEARAWWARNGFDSDEQNSMAWQGGYRSPQEIRSIDAYQQYAKSREAAAGRSPVTPPLDKDKFGLPIVGPIPARRDPRSDGFADVFAAQRYASDIAEQYALAGNRNRRFGAPRTMPDTSANWAQHEAASMGDYRKNYREIENEVSLALDGMAKDIGTRIADSGKPMGDTAADAIAAQADGIGARIAAAISSSLTPFFASVKADLFSWKPVGPGIAVNADLGRAGGDVQRSGGQ